jgi:hypothetical protein
MPKSKDKGQKEEQPEKPQKGGTLEKAAETVGATLGTIAAKIGVAKPKPKAAKLPKKNKQRLPRKQKKAAAKAKRAKLS